MKIVTTPRMRHLCGLFGLLWVCIAGAQSQPVYVLSEGFESVDVKGSLQPTIGDQEGVTIFANGWFRKGYSGSLGWERCETLRVQSVGPVYNAYDGVADSCIAVEASFTSDDPVASNWLLTPPITFDDTSELTFQTLSPGGDWHGEPVVDRLQVRVCTDGLCRDVGDEPEDVGQFGQLLLDINADQVPGAYPEQWTEFSLGAEDGLPTSGVGRIAFRYYLDQDTLDDNGRPHQRVRLDRVTVASQPGQTQDVELSVTATPYDPALPGNCDGSGEVTVSIGDRVNLCYRVVNLSDTPIERLWLRDTRTGALLTDEPVDLASGAAYQFNRVVAVADSETLSATTTALSEPLFYRVETASEVDYIDATDGEVIEPGETITAPFEFRWYGELISEYCAPLSHAATLHADKTGCPGRGSHGGWPFPRHSTSDALNSPLIGPYAELMWPDFGQIYQKVLGTAPNRRLVVQWYQKVPTAMPLQHADPEQGLDAQIVIHEGSDQVDFQYRNTEFGGFLDNNDGGNAAIGIQRGWQGISYSYLETALADVRRISWIPTQPEVTVDHSGLRIEVLAPELVLDRDAVDVEVEAGESAQQAVMVANLGEGRLDWSADTAPITSAVPPGASAIGMHDNPPSLTGNEPVNRNMYSFDLYTDFGGLGSGHLLRFDPRHTDYEPPDGANIVKDVDGIFLAAAFVDDDFTKMYAVEAERGALLRVTGLDTGSREVEEIGVLPFSSFRDQFVTGMSQDPTTGVVYFTTVEDATTRLWTLHLETATPFPAAELPGASRIEDIVFDKHGVMYGVDGVAHRLVQIDKHTGETHVVGNLGVEIERHFTALGYDGEAGVLYMLTNSGFWSVSLNTGTAHFISTVWGINQINPIALWATLAIAEPMAACTRPESVAWLSIEGGEGVIPAGAESQELTLDLDGVGLSDGKYAANLCIYSNDPLRRRVTLPVTLRVGAGGDSIFTDSFEE